MYTIISSGQKKYSKSDKKLGKPKGNQIDMSKIPRSWVGTFTEEEFKNVLNLNLKTGKFSVEPGYGDTLQDKLEEYNEVCVIRCTKRDLVQEGDKHFPTRQFFSAYAECIGDYCEAHFSFVIKEMPEKFEAVDVVIT